MKDEGRNDIYLIIIGKKKVEEILYKKHYSRSRTKYGKEAEPQEILYIAQ